MKFGKRLRLFGIGIGFGLILSYLFFHSRKSNWMPEDRVLMRLRANPLQFTDNSKCLNDCYGWTEENMTQLLDNGDVLFDESEPRKEPYPIYVVMTKKGVEPYMKISFEAIGDSATKVLRVWERNKECDC